MYKRFALVFFIVITCLQGYTQLPVYNKYTLEDGIPSMEIYNIIQDKKGFIWIATNKGVSRFEGNKFNNYSVENGLPDNEIIYLKEDKKGRIWFLSLTGTLSYYDDIIHNRSNTSFLNQELLQQTMKVFFPLNNDDILFSPRNMSTYTLQDTNITSFSKVGSNYIHEKRNHSIVLVDKQNNIIENSNGKIVSKITLKYNTEFDKNTCNTKTNEFLTVNNSGIYVYRNKQRHFIHNSANLTSQKIRFVTSDYEGYYWLSANNGCYRFSIDPTNQIINLTKYFEGFIVNDVFEDKDQNFWIATRGEGLLMCPSLNIKLYDKTSGLTDNNITTAIRKKDGTIICGTLNGNIHVISQENKLIESVNLKSARVQKILSDNDGNDWIACEQNIFRKNHLLTKTYSKPSSSYKTIAFSYDNAILIGGNARLTKYKNNKSDTILHDNNNLRFYAVCETKAGEIWIGTEKGLFTFKNNVFAPFHHDRKPFTGWINAIEKSANGNIFITTRDSGLAIVNNNLITFINTDKGLQSNFCTALFVDTSTEKIYLGTNKGLSIISMNKNNDFQISNFNLSNGLQSGSIFSIYENNKSIILCTDKGLLSFKEEELKGIYEIPKVYICSIEFNNKEVILDSLYFLNHNENNIRISYTGTSYRNPKSILYRYKLIPADINWNTTTSNTIVYPELAPGSYQFLVQIQMGNNTWNNESETFKFEIAKPYWQTWWFRASITLIIGSLVYSLYRYKINLARKKHELSTALLQTELKALRAQINPHFIFNSLNSIQDFIFNNEKEAANEYLTKFAKLMRMILDNSSKRFISLQEEINFLKIYLQLESLRFTDKFNYSINIQENLNTDSCYLPPMILQLYLENAILHGLAQKKDGGKLLLNFTIVNDELHCVIEDNGIGRIKSAELKTKGVQVKHQSHGMNNINERIEAINKSGIEKIFYEVIDLTDENGVECGTKIILNFPQTLFSK